MITDFQCNTVYFSALLQGVAPVTYANLISALDKHGVKHRLIPHTNDVWCRDYMPIQVAEGDFRGFTYDPDYLHETEEYLALRTDGNEVCREMGFEVKMPSRSLVIDSGNVIRCDDKVIMVEKVFIENPYPMAETAKAIEEHFNAELIVLPWNRPEYFGHADGLVRYAGDGRVILTNYDRYNKGFTRKVIQILQEHFTDVYKLEYDVPKQHKHNWAYINWLQTDKVLLIPSFGCPEDELAVEQITSYMPMYKGRVEMVPANDLIKHFGCLNCASWTVRV